MMTDTNIHDGWQTKLLGPRLPWGGRPPRPAEVGENLGAIMLSSNYALEDAEYNKIIPNQYIVELNQEHYARYFQPIETQVLKQWQSQLLERLTVANSRQGRKEYNLAGPLHIEMRAVHDLSPDQIRILFRFRPVKNGLHSTDSTPACLELHSSDRTWSLHRGVVTIGRNKSCDIYLNMPEVHEKRLVSGQHAYLLCEPDHYRLFDGSPDGKPSLNGTYVNYQPVPAEGHLLQEGDTIILAAIHPDHPRMDTPGVVTLRFKLECS